MAVLDDRYMKNEPSSSTAIEKMTLEGTAILKMPLEEAQNSLKSIGAQERLTWAINQFGTNFALTTSFGIQSAVLLHMLSLQKRGHEIPVIWVDTGYLPPETYIYAEDLTKRFNLNIKAIQSPISPARMEALYGKLWETNSIEDIEKYHLIRKVKPLEKALVSLEIQCWASGVRGNQTDHRRTMTHLDIVRERYSLRPLLEWSAKEVYYYMKENQLPQHPLFEKGYSTVGDWHSSSPDGDQKVGRETRFGGLKQECGIHVPGILEDGI